MPFFVSPSFSFSNSISILTLHSRITYRFHSFFSMTTPTKLSSTKAFGCTITRYEHVATSLCNLPAKFTLIHPPSSSSTTTPKGYLLWLSGLTCTDENFPQKACAAPFSAKYNVPIVCPDTSPRGAHAPEEDDTWDFGTGAGFYVNATEPGYDAYQMKSYILNDLLPLLKSLLGLSKVGVSGHSMGGMGALALAFSNPDVFTSVSAFAPISRPSVVPWGVKCFSKYIGADKKAWMKYDPCDVIVSGKEKKGGFQDVLVHQGDNDQFMSQLKPDELVKACEQAGQKLTLKMEPGYDHSYFFVQSFIEEHIVFHSKAFEC